MGSPAINHMSIERLSAAAAAVETIAQNNKQMLKHHYGTSSDDVMQLVMLARAHWFDMQNRGKGRRQR